MKKLMIALTAVAATALVAKAEETDLGGSDFNKMTTGAFDVNVQESSEAYGTASYWALPEDATSESQVVEASADDKYLKIEEAAVLERKINPNGTVDIPENGSVVISSKVQFTATEEETVKPDDGAKLAIWLKKTEADAEKGIVEALTLMVTAADESGDPKDYPTSVEVEENIWYDLVVTSTTDSDGIAQFTVKVGNTLIDQTFGSLDRSSGAVATIASVGFKGTGAVDDIAFTAVEGAEPVALAVNVTEGCDVLIYNADDEEVSEALPGETIKLLVAVAETATVTATGLEFAWNAVYESHVAEYTVLPEDAPTKTFTITVQSAPVGPTVIDPTKPQSYETAEAAQDAIDKGLVAVGATEAVAAALKAAEVSLDDYKAMFELKAIDNAVVQVLKTAVAAEVQNDVNTAEAAILQNVGAEATIATKPGLYYALESGAALDTMTVGTFQLATGTTIKLEVTKPSPEKGFYRVVCTPAPAPAE